MKKISSKFEKLRPMAASLGLLLAANCANAQSLQTNTFSFTGSMQTFTIPTCVTSLTITAYGAEGVSVGGYGFATGKGGAASGVFNTANLGGQALNIFVGGQNGYNGGGAGQNGGNGGGGSDVRFAGTAFSDRIIVAGGGGGAGGDNWNCTVGNGHGGGGTPVGTNFVGGGGGAGYTSGTGCGTDGASSGGNGGSGYHGGGGGGGGLNSGGFGATANSGTAGTGSLGLGGASLVSPNGCNNEGAGGGGGGYYGGGGAGGDNCGAGRGGGGSSWTGTLASPSFSSGVRLGNGAVVISYMSAAPNTPTNTVNVATSNSLGICPGNSVTLTASNVTSYTWAPNPSNAISINVSPNVSTTYSVFGINTAGCISMAAITVSVISPPALSISNTNTFLCLGETSTLTASGASTYTWMSTAGQIGSNAVVNVSPIATSIYTLIGASGAGCVSMISEQVNVDPLVMSVSANTVVCYGKSVDLSASGANNYVWSNGLPFQNISVTATVPLTYTVSGTNNNNCVISNTVSVGVNPLPNVTASASKTLLCKGETVVLTGGGASTYSWSGLGATASVSVTPALNTMYTYSVTGTDANGCVKGAAISIDVKLCTGLNELLVNNDLISVYPNPSTGSFNIQSDVNMNLNVVNQLGQVVKTVSLDDTHKQVTVSGLADGVYFITGENKGSVVNKKIVVAK